VKDGAGVVLLCKRCGIRNLIPATINYAPPMAEATTPQAAFRETRTY
jgi:hypothetical protein